MPAMSASRMKRSLAGCRIPEKEDNLTLSAIPVAIPQFSVLQKGCSLAFKSEETVLGCVRQSEERIEYRGILRVQESAANPVSLELDFIPPHPYVVNMPTRLSIHAQSVTEAYSKLVRVFDEHGVDLDT